jgi:LmbE family N-acetylglucosaminyl deacetylase
MKRLLRPLQPAAFTALQRVLFARGRDVTAELTGGPLLVIAPHPDDETLGCGAAIMRTADADHAVHIVIVCDGRHSHKEAGVPADRMAEIRRGEVLEACRRMGVPPERVTLLGHEDRHVAASAREAAEGLERIVAETNPKVILAPSGIDAHPDHRAIHAIVCRLVERGRIKAPVYEYPVWFWSPGAWMTLRDPALRRLIQLALRPLRTAVRSRPLLVRTDGYLERKRHAMDAFESQMRKNPEHPEWPVLAEDFLASFFRRYELFFPLLGAGAPAWPRPKDDPYAIQSGGLVWGWPPDASAAGERGSTTA